MGKMLGCTNCRDLILLHAEADYRKCPRTCLCGACHGYFLSDNHHVLLFGPAVALGVFNPDQDEAFQPQAKIESGYHPVRLWRIPDGDGIIIASEKTKSGWKITTPCWRCQPSTGLPCKYANISIGEG
jgi:hypothetical protein